MDIKGIVEGMLFVVGDEGITLKEMKEVIDCTEEELKESLTLLRKDYENNDRGIRISFLGNTFKLTTKEEHKEYYEKLVMDNTKTFSLSPASLEVLAVIAYNEPVTRLKIDEVRGVNSSQIVRRLLARGFIKECGKSDAIGRPNLYKTTNEFLDYFGLATKEDLPTIEMIQEENDEEKDLYTSKYTENKELVRQ